jgi:hypothetical protein
MKSPNLGERDDLSEVSVVGRPWIERILLKRRMRSGAIGVPGVGGKDPGELPLVEDHQVVQALWAQGANESLRMGV